MKTSPKGVKLIKDHEGIRLIAYPDPASGGDPWTIGYGTTHNVHPGMRITEADAEDMLIKSLPIYEGIIDHVVTVKLSQNEYDALVSFVYNVGSKHFLGSTVLRKLNMGDRRGAADALLMWNKGAGHVMAGLADRRMDERSLFLTA